MRKLLLLVFSLGLLSGLVGVTSAQSANEPVIIVPGFLASWNWKEFIGEDLPNKWQLTPLEGPNTYGNLIQSFVDQGYEMDKDLFLGLYDWRQSNLQSYGEYLMPVIDQALVNSPTGKVDIVAHSMGGLLARSYIQSDDYRDDVDQLVMVATPNNGSSDAYLLWSGGKTPPSTDPFTKVGASFFLWQQGIKNPGLYFSRKDIVQNVIPAAQELLPGYDFLVDDATGETISLSEMESQNPLLPVLNEVPDFSMGPWATPDDILAPLTKLTIITGVDKPTFNKIHVDVGHNSLLGKWKDGKPVKDKLQPDSQDGDGTVLRESAYLPVYELDTGGGPPVLSKNFFGDVLGNLLPKAYAQELTIIKHFFDIDMPDWGQQKVADSGHRSILTDAIPQIHEQLGLPAPSNTYAYTPIPDDAMAVFIASPVEPVLISGDGKELSKDTNDFGGQANYIDAGDPAGPKILIIQNPEDGDYDLQLSGVAEGDFHVGVYHTGIEESLADLEEEVVIPTLKGSTSVGQVHSFKVVVGSDEVPILEEVAVSESIQDQLRMFIDQVYSWHESGDIKHFHGKKILKRFSQAAIRQLDYIDDLNERYEGNPPVKIKRRIKIIQRSTRNNMRTIKRYIGIMEKQDHISDEAAEDLKTKLSDIMSELGKSFTR